MLLLCRKFSAEGGENQPSWIGWKLYCLRAFLISQSIHRRQYHIVNCFFFFFEFSHLDLQASKVLPWLNISPNCCIVCKNDGKSHIYLFFRCHFAKTFWDFILPEFGWQNAAPQDVWPILHFIFNGHLFRKDHKTLWLTFTRAFFWSTWLEHNSHLHRQGKWYLAHN